MHLYGKARLGLQLELLLEVSEPAVGVLYQVLVPHADALLASLHSNTALCLTPVLPLACNLDLPHSNTYLHIYHKVTIVTPSLPF